MAWTCAHRAFATFFKDCVIATEDFSRSFHFTWE